MQEIADFVRNSITFHFQDFCYILPLMLILRKAPGDQNLDKHLS